MVLYSEQGENGFHESGLFGEIDDVLAGQLAGRSSILYLITDANPPRLPRLFRQPEKTSRSKSRGGILRSLQIRYRPISQQPSRRTAFSISPRSL